MYGPPAPGAARHFLATAFVFLSLMGVVVGLALIFLGMRSVMEIGGSCATGGPYVPARPCPEGSELAILGGIWGGIACLAVYVWQTWSRHIPGLLGLAWPALFLSLGWNFLEYGIDPPGADGVEWGWLFCAVLFGLMGSVPLYVTAPTIFRGFFPAGANGPHLLGEDRAHTRSPSERILQTIIEGADREPIPPQSQSDTVGSLERLAALHRAGALSDAEFEEAKRRLLPGEL